MYTYFKGNSYLFILCIYVLLFIYKMYKLMFVVSAYTCGALKKIVKIIFKGLTSFML